MDSKTYCDKVVLKDHAILMETMEEITFIACPLDTFMYCGKCFPVFSGYNFAI